MDCRLAHSSLATHFYWPKHKISKYKLASRDLSLIIGSNTDHSTLDPNIVLKYALSRGVEKSSPSKAWTADWLTPHSQHTSIGRNTKSRNTSWRAEIYP